MFWGRKKLAKETSTDTKPTTFPLQIELVPDKLSARVFSHQLTSDNGPVSCWTYVSQGLWDFQQRELSMTLQRLPDEKPDDFSVIPLHFFVTVLQFAQEGRLVGSGDFTEFKGNGFLSPTFMGIAYLPTQPMVGVPAPTRPTLAAILLTPEELSAAKEFGLMRVMTHLGKVYSFYPYPAWADRTRANTQDLAVTKQQSILAKTATLGVWQREMNNVVLENKEITLRLSRQPDNYAKIQAFLKALDHEAVVTLLTGFEAHVDGYFTWQPSQTSPAAITPPGSKGARLGGCFMSFVSQQAEDSGQVFEDGLIMMLTSGSWQKVRQALQQGQDIKVPATKTGFGFSLKWLI